MPIKLHIESRSTVGETTSPKIPLEGWDGLLSQSEKLGHKSLKGIDYDWFLGLDQSGLAWLLGLRPASDNLVHTAVCLVGEHLQALRMAWEGTSPSEHFFDMHALLKEMIPYAIESEQITLASREPSAPLRAKPRL